MSLTEREQDDNEDVIVNKINFPSGRSRFNYHHFKETISLFVWNIFLWSVEYN